jgi:large-conductance mechanosensitive channel
MDKTQNPPQKPITSITATSKVPVIKQNTNVINQIVIYGLAVTAGFALKTLIQSFVFDVLEPLSYRLFSISKYTSKLINKNEQKLKFITFISHFISFIFIVLIVLIIIKGFFV